MMPVAYALKSSIKYLVGILMICNTFNSECFKHCLKYIAFEKDHNKCSVILISVSLILQCNVKNITDDVGYN